MGIQTAQNFSTTFRLDNDPANIDLRDTTDYAGESIDTSLVNGVFTITGPGNLGVIYSNTNFSTPDIDVDVSLDFDTVQLPLDAVTGEVVQGSYKFEYTTQIATTIIGVNQGSKIFTVSTDLVTSFPAGTTFEVTGSTGNDGTYTVASAVLAVGDTAITVVEAIPDATVDGIVELETLLTKEFDYCTDQPEADLTFEADCFCSVLTVTDTTAYGSLATLIVRTLTLISPPTLDPPVADVVTSLPSATVTPIFIATYSATLSTALTITQTDGLIIMCTVTGSDEFKVECSDGACELFCCLDKFWQLYVSKVGVNTFEAQQILDQKITPGMDGLVHYNNALKCGQNDRADQILQDIQKITGCSSDCDCNGDADKPVQVIPTCLPSGGSGNDVVVATCGNGIIVTSNTIGSTTTYTVCLDQDILDANTNALIDTKLTETDLTTLDDVETASEVDGESLFWRDANNAWNNEAINTGKVAEGSNLYYTDARARASLIGQVPIDYNSFNGVISITEFAGAGVPGYVPDPGSVAPSDLNRVEYLNQDGDFTVPPGDLPNNIICMFSGSLANFDGTGAGIVDTDVENWALCNGQNSTPDLRGQFVVGFDPTNVDYDTIGDSGGFEDITLVEAEMPAHIHTITDPGHQHSLPIADEGSSGVNFEETTANTGDTAKDAVSGVTGITIDSTGGGGAHENRPPYVTLAFIMRLVTPAP